MEQSQPSYFSRAAHDRLQEELKHNTGPYRLQISERIERARELGDIKENADYDAAKNEQGMNEARIRQLEQTLRDAVIVDQAETDVVNPLTVTTLLFANDKAPATYLIGSIEERSETYEVLSTSGPLGQELLGKRIGEPVSFETPNGKTIEVSIVDIQVWDLT